MEYVCCENFGIGKVQGFEKIGSNSFLVIELLNKSKIKVPENSGKLRTLLSYDQIMDLKKNHTPYKACFSNWNQLSKHFSKKMNSTQFTDLLDVVSFFENKEKLTFEEKKMLKKAKEMIDTEINLSIR